MAALRHTHPVDRLCSPSTRSSGRPAGDGRAGALSSFVYVTLPHLARADHVVILIETIFLLTVFAEIFVTTVEAPDSPRPTSPS